MPATPRLALVPLVALALACASGPRLGSERIETPDGVIYVDTLEVEATVEAIDARDRTLRLRPGRGEPATFAVPAEVVNFDQIQVGDKVRAVLVEETAIQWVGPSDQLAAGVDSVVLAPRGAKPGGIAVGSRAVFGTIVAIDSHDHSVTVELPDGEVRELQVAKHRDLSALSLGDAIRFRVSEALAVSVEPAAK